MLIDYDTGKVSAQQLLGVEFWGSQVMYGFSVAWGGQRHYPLHCLRVSGIHLCIGSFIK